MMNKQSMRRVLLTLLAIAGFNIGTIRVGDKIWYNRFENLEHVVTSQVGEISNKTQGVVTIYGADWCGPCNKLEKQIKESGLAEELVQEGIAFRFIRNQPDEEGGRVNEFIKREIKEDTTDLKFIPCIFIDDLGRSYKGDKRELAIGRLGGKFEGLEEYIRRYALDQSVHLLTNEEVPKVLEAIGSSLFNVQYGLLWQNGRKGFNFIPKNIYDSETRETLERLQTIGNAVRIWDSRVNKRYQPNKIKYPKYLPREQQLKDIQVEPSCLEFYNSELIFLKEKMREFEKN